MVTGLAEGEAVCGLISWLTALVCRAISPSLSVVLTWCHALTGQIKPCGGKSVRFGSTNSQQVPQRCPRLVSVEPPFRSGICLYQASGIEKYCLANVCFGLDSPTVFTWEALPLHLENNDGTGGLLWERDTMRQDRCAADFLFHCITQCFQYHILTDNNWITRETLITSVCDICFWALSLS